MFDQIFLSPQVTQSVIINNKHDIYELPHELSNGLRFMMLESIRKYQENPKNA